MEVIVPTHLRAILFLPYFFLLALKARFSFQIWSVLHSALPLVEIEQTFYF